MKTTPRPRYLSTICVDCRKAPPGGAHTSHDGKTISNAEHLENMRQVAAGIERMWEDNPVEVAERKCRECKRYRHWWFFTLGAEQTARLFS